ncbi:MAG: hypothetical protein Q4C70_14830 [Planctomycetia bacterium]|nr:hypothetical protein [Planctomycetia bacterium]
MKKEEIIQAVKNFDYQKYIQFVIQAVKNFDYQKNKKFVIGGAVCLLLFLFSGYGGSGGSGSEANAKKFMKAFMTFDVETVESLVSEEMDYSSKLAIGMTMGIGRMAGDEQKEKMKETKIKAKIDKKTENGGYEVIVTCKNPAIFDEPSVSYLEMVKESGEWKVLKMYNK